MEISVAVLADAANVELNQKLNILGIFDLIPAVEFPTVHPSMALAIRLRLDFNDAEKAHGLDVLLVDEDRRVGAKVTGNLQVGHIPPGESRHHNQIFNLLGIAFPRPGRYFVEVYWDGELKTTITLTVAQVERA